MSILKLKDVNELSLFPILDEVGLSQTSRNVFSSPWDNDYYLRTIDSRSSEINIIDEVIVDTNYSQIYNIEIVSGIDNYYKGINIYGKTYTEDYLLGIKK